MSQRMPTVFVGGPFTQALIRDPKTRFDPRIRAKLEYVHRAVLTLGCDLLSSHLAENFGEETDLGSVAPRDLNWAEQCDCYVAVLAANDQGSLMRSDGTFVELGFCLALKKKVLLLYESPRWLETSDFLRSLALQPSVVITSWDDFQAQPKVILLNLFGNSNPL